MLDRGLVEQHEQRRGDRERDHHRGQHRQDVENEGSKNAPDSPPMKNTGVTASTMISVA